MTSEKIQIESKDLPSIRTLLLEAQGGCCKLCKRSVVDYPDIVMCVDHCHKSGLVRAVLCSNCNSLSGRLENIMNRAKAGLTNLEWLDNFVDYIKAEHTVYIHPSVKPKARLVKVQSFKALKKLYKIRYPKKKDLGYPKSCKLTKQLKKLFDEFGIEDYYYKE